MSEQEYDKEQLRILRNAFKAFDHDEKGTIDYSDVQAILEIIGQKLDEKAIKGLIKEVDKKNSGKLDFRQFCALAARFIEVEEDANALAAELKEAFRVYDKEGKGYITVAILRDILHELDDKLTKNELDMIIEEIDADGSGTVDFDEFMEVMTGKNYYELIHNRCFTFDPVVDTRCNCHGHRMSLHRRIELHFERFLDQFFNPFQLSVRKSPVTKVISSASNQTSVVSPGPCLSANPKKKESSVTTISTTNCCYRPFYRPRFPKWVPILTLYREILQNPFRRRGRLMLTQY